MPDVLGKEVRGVLGLWSWKTGETWGDMGARCDVVPGWQNPRQVSGVVDGEGFTVHKLELAVLLLSVVFSTLSGFCSLILCMFSQYDWTRHCWLAQFQQQMPSCEFILNDVGQVATNFRAFWHTTLQGNSPSYWPFWRTYWGKHTQWKKDETNSGLRSNWP